MPNRILRDGILTSERVNALSSDAEVFYRRLHSVADDFGRYTGHVALLRAALYPLQLDRVQEAAIKRHLAECVKVRLVLLYSVDGKQFVEVLDFRQQVRAKESKYPQPLGRCNDDASQPHQKRINGLPLDANDDATQMHSISSGASGSSSQVPENQQKVDDAALMRSRCSDDAHLDGDGDGDGDDISSPAGDGVKVLLTTKQHREAFDAFWQVYPKKVGKVPAEKAWQRHGCTTLREQILAAVRQQKESPDWRKDGGQFVPHPTTWLNQHRWQDEPPNSGTASVTFIP